MTHGGRAIATESARPGSASTRSLATEPVKPAPTEERTPLLPDEEQAFRWWYSQMAEAAGLDPDPDAPEHEYDWRGAFKAGARAVMGEDGRPHWPSEYKRIGHPNLVVDGQSTRPDVPSPGTPNAAAEARPSGLVPLAEFLRRAAQGPMSPSPVTAEDRAAGARATLQGLEGPTAHPGAPYLPDVMTDAQPLGAQIEHAVEEYPEHFIDDPDAKAIPRPGERETEREWAARTGRRPTFQLQAPAVAGAS